MRRIARGGAVAWALAAAAVMAQPRDSATALRPIEVIGTTPFAGSEVDADRYPANVQTRGGAAIDDAETLNVSEFLNQELGSVHVNDAVNNPFQPDLKYRGFTASPLLGLPQGLSIYQDGVRVNEPFGDTVNWDLIPQAAIARVSLIPGSNPVFGLNTLGGAISVETKTGFSHPGTKAQLYAGDFGRTAGHVTAGGNNGRDAWFLAVQGLDENGWRDFSDSEVAQAFGRYSRVTDTGRLDFSITAADNRLRGNGAVPAALAESEGRDAIFTFPDETSPELLMFNLGGARDFSQRLAVSWGAYYRRNDIATFNGDGSEFGPCEQPENEGFTCELEEREEEGEEEMSSGEAPGGGDAVEAGDEEVVVDRNGQPIPFSEAVDGGTQNTSETEQNGWGFNVQARLMDFLGGELINGVSLSYASSDFASQTELARLTAARGTEGSGFFSGKSLTRVTARNYTASWFFLHRLPITNTVETTLSGRFNFTNITLVDHSPPVSREEGTSLDGDHDFERLNLAAGLAWDLTPGLTAFGNVSQSSRAPTPLELTCANPDAPCRLPNGFVDDPPLAQVVTTTFELGARGGSETLSWRAALFSATNADDILFIAAESRFEGFFDNVADTRRQGLEVGLAWQALPDLRLRADYSFVEAEFRDAFRVNSLNHPVKGEDGEIPAERTQQVRPGDRIPLVPEHIYKVGADWDALPRLTVGVDVVGNSDQIFRGDESNTDSEQIDGFTIVHIHGEYGLTQRVTAFLRVNNALDEEYETFGVYGESDEVLEGERFENANRFIAPGAPRGIWGGLRIEL